ncbi:MAG: dihydrolipoyl dehydrogenase [Firmicutes bacterium]|jgi:dihydrolipoamide dehydrogenase|nr:dihydrolipoyl dehydrogenase [Bacillota bacterium]
MYDLVILGGGPGGYVCAIRAAQYGLRCALVEKADLGGTCLNWGCIPTKALAHTADMVADARRGAEFGISIPAVDIDFPRVMSRKDRVVARLRNGVGFLLKKWKVDVISGRGRIDTPGAVLIEAADGSLSRVETRNIVVATGSVPIAPKMLGHDGRNVLTSEEVLSLTSIPSSILVVGAGVIGCEFASIFRTFGSEVTMVDIMPTILPMVDSDVASVIAASFQKRGIKIHTATKITEVDVSDGLVQAKTDTGEVFRAEKVILSMGRKPYIGGSGAVEAGLELGPAGEIVVDSRLRTSEPGIWAIGDVTNKNPLAHVASAQGLVVAANIAGRDTEMEYHSVPSCIFTSPEVGTVGFSEVGARASGISYVVGKFPFAASGKAVAMGEVEGFVKILAEQSGRRVIGGHIVGPHASDLIAELALAVQNRLTIEDVAHTIHAHPTLAETVMESAEAAMGLAVHI